MTMFCNFDECFCVQTKSFVKGYIIVAKNILFETYVIFMVPNYNFMITYVFNLYEFFEIV